jgi:protein involved in polysaccharide export with SLBB domain
MTFSPISFLACFLCVAQIGLSAGQKYAAPPPEFFQSGAGSRATIIAAGDVLTVRFYYNPELNKTVKVREDGKISLDLFQGIPAAGQTPEELQKTLVGLYSKEFTKPEITVDVDSRANSAAYVTGEVLLPGAKELHGKMTVAMVLAMSQVNQRSGSTKSVYIMRLAEAGKYRVYKVDASFPGGSARDIEVAPGDVLFVPRKGIVKADDIIEQYFRQLLPASPSASASVLFTPGSAIYNTVAAGH